MERKETASRGDEAEKTWQGKRKKPWRNVRMTSSGERRNVIRIPIAIKKDLHLISIVKKRRVRSLRIRVRELQQPTPPCSNLSKYLVCRSSSRTRRSRVWIESRGCLWKMTSGRRYIADYTRSIIQGVELSKKKKKEKGSEGETETCRKNPMRYVIFLRSLLEIGNEKVGCIVFFFNSLIYGEDFAGVSEIVVCK